MVADQKSLQYTLHTSGCNFPKTPDASHTIRPQETGLVRRQSKVMAAAFLTQFQITARVGRSLTKLPGGIREVSRAIFSKSVVKGGNCDIISVLLRANNSEDGQIGSQLHLIIWQLSRCATLHDVILLAFPIMAKLGEQISAIPIRKGAHIDPSFCSYSRWVVIPHPLLPQWLRSLRLPEVWGEDAYQ
ncbi:hypothetical protein EDB87DRAFT_1573865 [Lactarius vividus]|nr:hypothetical protein EDB87DRAFT_1573865 [Lactarius vividus]